MESISYLPLIVVPIVAAIAGITDAWKFKIYNSVTIPLILSGILFHSVTHGSPGFVHSIGGLAIGFLLLLFPYVLGAMGAGDVKLMAGIGAWLGPSATVVVFFIAALVSAMYSGVLMVRQGAFGDLFTNLKVLSYQVSTMGRHLGAHEGVKVVVKQENRRRRLVPFAVMIAIAVLVTSALAWKSA